MASDMEEVVLVKKPNATSIVWNYFGLEANEQGTPKRDKDQRPVCRSCKKSIPAKGGNTSNLMAHLKEHHAELYVEALSAQKSRDRSTKGKYTVDSDGASTSNSKHSARHPSENIKEALLAGKKFAANSPQAIELNKAVTYFIAKDAQPFSTVEKPGFKRMISKLNPRYQLPSRRYFVEHEILQLYSEIKEKTVVPKLLEAKHFAVTTDFWTSITRVPFMSFTVHFIDNDWILRSYCLDTVPSYEDHTGENIAAALQDVLENWQLSSENLVATTTDNASNYVAAFDTLGWTRVSCFGHNLNLAVSKAVDNCRIQHALGRCHSLIELFSRSWKKTRDLRLKQEQLGLPRHKLITDVSTRWGSTYMMVARIVEQQQAICAVLAEDRKHRYKMPTDTEFSTLEAVVKVFEPLSYFTDALSGEKHVTASAIRPLLKHIHEKILLVSSNDCTITKEMKMVMSNDLKSRYTTMLNELLDICSYLDPRFRSAYLYNKEEAIFEIKREAIAIAEKGAIAPNTVMVDEEESNDEPPKKKLKGLAAILKHSLSLPTMEEITSEDKVEREMRRYQDFPAVAVDVDPLEWWKSEQKNYPTLATLAQKYLCICGTSVSSERLFSKAGYIVNAHRNRLSPDHVNTLLFLAKNIS